MPESTLSKEPVLVVIQARAGATRLPNKIFEKIAGYTLLGLQVARLRRALSVGEIVIATSTDPSDDATSDEAFKLGVPCFRGSLTDVAGRFAELLRIRSENLFVRYCADRPFFDWRLLDHGVDLIRSSGAKLVTNVFPPCFPKGQTVELMDRKLFLDQEPKIVESADREHVTSFFYRTLSPVNILNFVPTTGNYSDINLCIDTLEDLTRAREVASALGDKLLDAEWMDVVQRYRTLGR